MVHVEVQYRDALDGAACQRVGGGDSDVVVVTKSHGRCLARVVPGRPHATEGRGNAALEHEFCREHGRASRMTGGGQRIRA